MTGLMLLFTAYVVRQLAEDAAASVATSPG
jgi:hypothetical protein